MLDERLYDHLSSLGLDIYLEPDVAQSAKYWGQTVNLIGVIGINSTNIDSVAIVKITRFLPMDGGRREENYFDYIVRPQWAALWDGVKLVNKKKFILFGSIYDIDWKGNDDLADNLASDFELREMLLAESQDGPLSIETFQDEDDLGFFTTIRTQPIYPTENLFQCLNSIAGYIHDYSNEYG